MTGFGFFSACPEVPVTIRWLNSPILSVTKTVGRGGSGPAWTVPRMQARAPVGGRVSTLIMGNHPTAEAKHRSIALYTLGGQPASLQSWLTGMWRGCGIASSYWAAGLNIAIATVGNDGYKGPCITLLGENKQHGTGNPLSQEAFPVSPSS